MNPELYQQLVAAVSGRGLAEDWFRLGALLVDMRRRGAASVCFARVVGMEPGHFMAWANWGWCAHLLGEGWVAEERLRTAIGLAPGVGHPHALLCVVLDSLGRSAEAVEEGRRGVEMEPSLAVNHVGYALALAGAGKWEEMWREYEHRFQFKIPEFLSRPYRLWRGERVERLLIECEQGLGDTIFALRWLGEAAARVGQVLLYVQKELYGLVVANGVAENVEVYPIPRAMPLADAFCPMLSLPTALGLGGPGDERPYINPQGRVWHGSHKPKKIGICWAGNPGHDNAHHRDCPLAYWFGLGEIPGVELHSLQVGAGAEQLSELGGYGVIVDRGPEMTNFLDTVHVLAGLDLLVSVDTAAAHLAGAMGMPCWLLVNQRGRDFRIPPKGEVSGWYPAHRIYRRSHDEQWPEVMWRVAEDLRGFVG